MKWVLIGVVFVGLFTYVYGFYKTKGVDAVEIVASGGSLQDLESSTNRDVNIMLLGDFARADVQSYVLYKLYGVDEDYSYALGRTYLAALVLPVPKAIWPNRPVTKVKEGTEIQYGRGSFLYRNKASSRQYGLAGEAMLNFGPLGVLLAFFIWGMGVQLVRRKASGLHLDSPFVLLLPFLINLVFVALIVDSDNLVFWLFKNGMIPFVLIALSIKKTSPATANVTP